MYEKVTLSKFREAFKLSGRGNQFSYSGLGALFDYLEEYENACGQELELDVISLGCDFCEYESLSAFQEDNNFIKSMEDLERHTLVIPVADESFIIQVF